MTPTTLHLIGTALFALALVHTFSTAYFERLAHASPRHAGAWHLLGEVEVVFGVWAMVLVLFMMALAGRQAAADYLESRNYTEPMFVFAIMVVAGRRPRKVCAMMQVLTLAWLLLVEGAIGFTFAALAFVPLLGSLITEPAAMTLAALILRERLFGAGISTKLKYAALGTLFVNVSIGGTLTPFAAPPVLMVAGTWGWDMAFMLTHFGWKAALAVTVNAAAAMWWFRRELAPMAAAAHGPRLSVPPVLVAVHLFFLAAVVVCAHHPVVFLGLLLFFLGVVTAYPRHQSPLVLREALLVAFSLAGLVVLGGLQRWWLQPLLMGMSADGVFFGAAALTVISDYAALT